MYTNLDLVFVLMSLTTSSIQKLIQNYQVGGMSRGKAKYNTWGMMSPTIPQSQRGLFLFQVCQQQEHSLTNLSLSV